MKVTLVEVDPGLWKTGIYTRHSAVDPISIEYIGAVARKEGHNVKILQQRIESADDLVDKILAQEPDLIGYSCMTWGFPFAKELATRIKEKRKVINVFGGYHVSAVSEEDVAKDIDETIDFVVLGEGEYTFRDLLNCLKYGGKPEEVRGIAFRKNKKLIVTEPRQRIKNLDELPWPIRTKEYLEGNQIVSQVYPVPAEQKGVAQIAYSRGCPYHCSYCASPTLWGSEVRHRSARDVVGEIEYLQKEFGTNFIFFNDLTFNLNKKKVYELCDEIKRRNIEIYWYAMCRPDPDENLLKEMKEAGCTRIAFGVEALSDSTLEKALRGHSTREAIETVKISDSLGILTRAFLIVGWPEEQYKNLEDYVNKNNSMLKEYARNGLDGTRVSFLTPFPGTPLYTYCKQNNLFLTKDFSRFSSDEQPIIKLKGINPEELIKARERIFKAFYASDEYSQHIEEKIKRFPHLKGSFSQYLKSLNASGY